MSRFSRTLDNSETRIVRLIEHATMKLDDSWMKKLRVWKNTKHNELLEIEDPPAKLDSHFFYTYYSIMLHLSSGALCIMGFQRIDLDDECRWLCATREFTAGTVFFFSAMDLITHLEYILACAKNFNSKSNLLNNIDEISCDWKGDYHKLGTLLRKQSGRASATNLLCSQLRVHNQCYCMCELHEWFRNRLVHGQFHYITQTKQYLKGGCKSPWCMLDPRKSTTDINNYRDTVNEEKAKVNKNERTPFFNWDVLGTDPFLNTMDQGTNMLLAAEDVMRALLNRAADALVLV